jgi:hypothetical protein
MPSWYCLLQATTVCDRPFVTYMLVYNLLLFVLFVLGVNRCFAELQEQSTYSIQQRVTADSIMIGDKGRTVKLGRITVSTTNTVHACTRAVLRIALTLQLPLQYTLDSMRWWCCRGCMALSCCMQRGSMLRAALN